MQTFLPYKDFKLTAKCLDNKRLGKQRVEAFQILLDITGEKKTRWRNHPAVKMWQGYDAALIEYGITICNEWVRRGFQDSMRGRFWVRNLNNKKVVLPDFIGNEEFHKSHKSNLLRKNYKHYSRYFSNVPTDLKYVWPK